MNCPKCGHGWSKTVDCRMHGTAKKVKKQCTGCGNWYTIFEISPTEYNRYKKQEKTINQILSLMEVLKGIENEDIESQG